MNEIDKRSLWVFDYAVQNERCTIGEMCKRIGLKQPGYNEITAGKRGFTHEQLKNLLQFTNASADWVYGFSNERFRAKKNKKPLQQFNEAVAVIREFVK